MGCLIRILYRRHQVGNLIRRRPPNAAIHLNPNVWRYGQLVMWHDPVVHALGVKVGLHLTLPLHIDRPPVVKVIPHLVEDAVALLTHLDAALDAGGVHPAGDVHRVPPDVIQQLGGADDPGREGAVVKADAEFKVKPQHVVVEVIHHPHHFFGKFKKGLQVPVGMAAVLALRGVQPRRRHVGGPDGFDLLDAAVVGFAQQLIEVPDELVEDSVALLATLVVLLVELAEVHDAGKDHPAAVVVFGIALGHLQLLGHVVRDDVPQQPVSLIPHALDLGAVQVGLHVPVVVQPVADLELAVQEPDQQEQQEGDQNHLLAHQLRRPPGAARHRAVAGALSGAAQRGEHTATSEAHLEGHKET
ncbi:hypothetical protein DV515_00008045 [Chloebia gouldiae]|uniref:Uncharacterized protein n=1 Tax=Chloebia gouldiae TaxID=44316 RepID=A0A3L8SGP3_CHLGU|nr:hypothetical protein DV515_00008045 [Chloebia gouldiae]